MVTSEQMRRLEKLEAQTRAREFEHSPNDPEIRRIAALEAERHGLDVDELIAESLIIARHIAEIGQDAWRAECDAEENRRAEQFGMSIEQYRSIDWMAEHEEWVAEGSIPGAWIGRDWGV